MTGFNLSPQEIAVSLNTDLENGLTHEEAQTRLNEFGQNIINLKQRDGVFKLFIDQLKNPIVLLLVGTSVIAGITGEVIESVLITSIVVFMAFIGVFLENTAGNALDKLKKLISLETIVIREGKKQAINVSDLVPGDLIYLHEGDKVPADARVVEENELQADESILTGESVAVEKNIGVIKEENISMGDQINMIFSGTFIIEGNCKAIVINTATRTELGRIAEKLAEIENKQTPLQIQLEKLSKLILILTLCVSALVLVFGVIRGQTIIDSLIQSLSLAIAFVPEGLSAVMTVTLAIGVREMVKQNVIIKRLIAAEGLGSVSILATDKTGTITTGKMTVAKLWAYDKEVKAEDFIHGNYLEQKIIDVIKYCNNQRGATENALIKFLESKNIEFDIGDRVQEHRFSSIVKRMMVINKSGQSLVGYSKGAPDLLIPLCSQYYDPKEHTYKEFTVEKRKKVLQTFEKMAGEGYRVLSLAVKEFKSDHILGDREKDEENLIFIALIALMDPIRNEVAETVSSLITSGIRPIMITGDHKEIARTIAFQARIISSLDDRVITGQELEEYIDRKNNLTLKDIVNTSVFARVTPQHKNMLIKIFQEGNKSIAMAGDGVNDAVAISKADIGIAVVNATDIVKDAADVIITGDYSALGNAVKVGRVIIYRTRLYLHFLLSGNICQVGVFLLSFAAGLPVPLTPIGLLLINLLTDAAPAMSMAIEKEPKDILKEKPRKKDEGIINKMMWRSIFIQGLFSSIYLFVIFYILLPQGIEVAQTATFTAYIFHNLLRVITARSFKESVFSYGIFSNKFNVLAAAFALAAWALIVFVFGDFFGMVILPLELLAVLFVSSLAFPMLEEIIKYRNRIDFSV